MTDQFKVLSATSSSLLWTGLEMKKKIQLMTVIKLLKLVRSGRGELCYSLPFVTRLLFVKGAWSHEAESTGQLAALKTVSDEGMTNLGKQKMGAGSVMWECSCDHLGDALTYPTFEPLFVLFSVYSLAVFSPPWADRAGPCLAQSRLVARLEWKPEKVTDKQCLVAEELVTDDQAKPSAWYW